VREAAGRWIVAYLGFYAACLVKRSSGRRGGRGERGMGAEEKQGRHGGSWTPAR